MTDEEARKILKGIEMVGGSLPEDGDLVEEALLMAIKALEQISHLKGRPCEVCEFHTDKGCRRWKCIFEEVQDE